jgi:ribosome-associated protein
VCYERKFLPKTDLKSTHIDGKELALEIARYADEIQAEDITILDLQGNNAGSPISTLTDFFVICTGTSMPHLKAIRREIARKLAAEHGGQKAGNADGTVESHWIVVDYADVIVHIFHKDMRPVYSLEDLWSDAPRVDFTPQPA